MTSPSTALTTLLKQFGLTAAAEELVPRLTQDGHHDADRDHGAYPNPVHTCYPSLRRGR